MNNTDAAKTNRTLNEINESRSRNGLELIDRNDPEAMSIVQGIAGAKDLKRAGDRIDLYGDKLLLEGNATENQVTETVDALKNSFIDKSYAIDGGVAPRDVSSFGKPIDSLFKGTGRLANSFGGFMSENPVAMYALQGIEFAAAPGLTALRMAATELTPLGDMIAAAQKTMIDTVATKMVNDGYGHEDAVNGGTGAFVMASMLGVGVAGALSRIDSVANVIAGVRNRLRQAADKAFGDLDVSQNPFGTPLSQGADIPDAAKTQRTRSGPDVNKILRGVDPHTLIRTHSLSGKRSAENIEEISASMRQSGFKGDPIDVVEANGKYYIVDGHHRAVAALQTRTQVDIRVVQDIKNHKSSWGSIEEVIRDAQTVGPNRLTPKGKYKR